MPTSLLLKDEAEDVVKQIGNHGQKGFAVQLNVGDAGGFNDFWKEVAALLSSSFGVDKLDYLINNAGTGYYASFAETAEAQFDALVNIHLKGAFFLTQKGLSHLADGGGIINISSGLARFSQPGYAAYASMKGAIETLTRYQAKELGVRGIRVNVVAPGAIETDFGGGVVRDNADVNAFLASQTALGRVGLPDDIGSVVAFLCTDDAKWITAQRIEASGGMFL